MNKVNGSSGSKQSKKQVKNTRITILGYIINTIYEVPTKQVGESADRKC